ncbi:MAG TPA: hypothetical protein VEQ60_06550 [Longimicrobium sp.]|nr:hypothetical protein [Longimicrobium sp.]
MFRITRGHHVQHIHFPLPVIRDLDEAEDAAVREDANPPKAAAPEERVEADPSTGAAQ